MAPMRRGFTFIELMSVFAIIAILAAILFPVFARAREKARHTNCLANLQNIGAGLRMYAADHYGHFPPTDNDLAPLFPKVLSDPGVLLCPSESALARPMRPAPGNAELASDYICRGGLEDDGKPLNLVACDRRADLHNEGANYLLLDGHAKWYMPRNIDPEGPDHGLLGTDEIAQLRGENWPPNSDYEPVRPRL